MIENQSKISAIFRERNTSGQMAFIPFVAAGDPDLSGTRRLLLTLDAAGADLIEVGFPYSDPIADGPVIQASYTRALKQNITVNQIFSTVEEVSAEISAPLVAMVSYAIIFRHGTDRFLSQAVEAGFQGFIIPDLPAEEAGEFSPKMQAAGLDLIQLLAPTTTEKRTLEIIQNSSGFIYCIAVAGTTGEREMVAEELVTQLRQLREKTETPLAVGFGISKPEHLDPLREVADGVIVGSAIMKYLQQVENNEADFDSALSQIELFTRGMSEAAHTKSEVESG